jgi:2-desacetyl-2-hydroxyethyl bacteriochlorophyllide A dehydrogenase
MGMVGAMNAIRVFSYGGPDCLELGVTPRPSASQGEVLIEVAGAGINPVDCKTRAGGGIAGRLGDNPFPIVLGWDVAGTVVELGAGVTEFAVGDRVFGCVNFPRLAGAYAEYASAPVGELARVPEGLDLVDAAAMPLAVLTAWQALDAANLEPGQRLLVTGASGGVGHFVLQLAQRRGAEVVAITSTRNLEFVRSLGAHEAIDYTSDDVVAKAGDVDVLFDARGSASIAELWPTLRRGGAIVSILGGFSAEKVPEGIRGTNILIRPDGAQLARVAELVAARRLVVHVEQVYSMADAPGAHEQSETGHVRGKLVLRIA